MRSIRCCSLALVGLFVALAGYAPRAFGQSFDLGQAVAVADLTPQPNQQVLRVSLSDRYIQTVKKCASPVVEIGEKSGLVLSTVHLSLGVGPFVQSKLAPDCVLPVDYTDEQLDRWLDCVENLECEQGYAYLCWHRDGNELFITCDADDCE